LPGVEDVAKFTNFERFIELGNFNKLFRFCDRTGDFIILCFKFLTNRVWGFWRNKAGEALGSRGSRDDGNP
jgi:hypothetical protein